MKTNKLIIKKLISSQINSNKKLDNFKRKIAKQYKINCPSNISLLKAYHEMVREKSIKKNKEVEKLLQTRPVRSLSGIVNVSVLTKPYPCPGKCLYCPQEKGVPKSYLSGEPAVQRAKSLNYNPYLQTKSRLEMLEEQGHPTDKVELRIIGGTWSYYPPKYQNWFIKKCFDACNEKSASGLKKAHTLNETAQHRIVGLSVETRPDFINKKEIIRLRKLGVTKVEMGIQSIYDSVLKSNRRGHKVKATIEATEMLKNAGFKVSYQIMPNLPGSNPKKDAEMFKEIFNNPDFQPDFLKIYPCALLKEAPLYNSYQKKRYKPYSEKTLKRIIKEIKKQTPYYVRIERIIRDIPSPRIIKGPTKISNLRQLILEEMEKEKWNCKCIRCREIKDQYDPREKVFLFRQDYEASNGREIFLSFESKKRGKLYSLLRLRIPQKPQKTCFFDILKASGLIREIHTFGQMVPISGKKIAPQHQGLGKKLIKTAEKITKKEFELDKIVVISAIGTRQYYRKIGYKLQQSYMVKKLN